MSPRTAKQAGEKSPAFSYIGVWGRARHALQRGDIQGATDILVRFTGAFSHGFGCVTYPKLGTLTLMRCKDRVWLEHTTGVYPLSRPGMRLLRKRLKPQQAPARKRKRTFDINDWI